MNSTISIVLVEPESCDNIGAVARAMKNMTLSDLRLVRPPVSWRSEARKLAVGAKDLLDGARSYSSLSASVRDRQWVIGTTRRQGTKRGRFRSFEETLRALRGKNRACRHAIVFGKESKGLANRDLALCDWITTIPSNPRYPSLNLAQAVMVFAFALYAKRGLPRRVTASPAASLWVTNGEIEQILASLRKALELLNYREEGAGVIERIAGTWRRMVKRGGLLTSEAQMFKGLLRRIRERCEL